MPDIIQAIGSELSRDMDDLRVRAARLANINTVGFQASLDANSAADATTSSPERIGKLRTTGRALDVAILGSGWLVTHAADGSLRLTRNGRLHVDAEGYLTNAPGHRVAGEQGDIRVPASRTLGIAADGTLMADGHAISRLLVAERPADAVALPDGTVPVTDWPTAVREPRVAAGVLEYPDIDLATEMTHLMTTSRHLESTQKALQLYDGVLATGIGQIGKE